jgi:hypothetical protein
VTAIYIVITKLVIHKELHNAHQAKHPDTMNKKWSILAHLLFIDILTCYTH